MLDSLLSTPEEAVGEAQRDEAWKLVDQLEACRQSRCVTERALASAVEKWIRLVRSWYVTAPASSMHELASFPAKGTYPENGLGLHLVWAKETLSKLGATKTASDVIDAMIATDSTSLALFLAASARGTSDVVLREAAWRFRAALADEATAWEPLLQGKVLEEAGLVAGTESGSLPAVARVEFITSVSKRIAMNWPDGAITLVREAVGLPLHQYLSVFAKGSPPPQAAEDAEGIDATHTKTVESAAARLRRMAADLSAFDRFNAQAYFELVLAEQLWTNLLNSKLDRTPSDVDRDNWIAERWEDTHTGGARDWRYGGALLQRALTHTTSRATRLAALSEVVLRAKLPEVPKSTKAPEGAVQTVALTYQMAFTRMMLCLLDADLHLGSDYVGAASKCVMDRVPEWPAATPGWETPISAAELRDLRQGICWSLTRLLRAVRFFWGQCGSGADEAECVALSAMASRVVDNLLRSERMAPLDLGVSDLAGLLELERGDFLRLRPESEARLLALASDAIEFQLLSGDLSGYGCSDTCDAAIRCWRAVAARGDGLVPLLARVSSDKLGSRWTVDSIRGLGSQVEYRSEVCEAATDRTSGFPQVVPAVTDPPDGASGPEEPSPPDPSDAAKAALAELHREIQKAKRDLEEARTRTNEAKAQAVKAAKRVEEARAQVKAETARLRSDRAATEKERMAAKKALQEAEKRLDKARKDQARWEELTNKADLEYRRAEAYKEEQEVELYKARHDRSQGTSSAPDGDKGDVGGGFTAEDCGKGWTNACRRADGRSATVCAQAQALDRCQEMKGHLPQGNSEPMPTGAKARFWLDAGNHSCWDPGYGRSVQMEPEEFCLGCCKVSPVPVPATTKGQQTTGERSDPSSVSAR